MQSAQPLKLEEVGPGRSAHGVLMALGGIMAHLTEWWGLEGGQAGKRASMGSRRAWRTGHRADWLSLTGSSTLGGTGDASRPWQAREGQCEARQGAGRVTGR